MLKAGYIAIIGRPNSGKSTLMNLALRTEISIVTPKAQTTREKIFGIYTDPRRGQIVFMDTPGIHRARGGGLNEYMVNEARKSLEAPDLIWYLVDPSSSIEHEQIVVDMLTHNSAPVFLLFNKSDRAFSQEGDRQRQKQEVLFAALKEKQVPIVKSLEISGLKGKGVQELLEESLSLLPEGPFFYSDHEQLSDRPTRFFVAEKIRERLYHCLGDELPYSCAVEIVRFDESSKPVRIEADIHVERESQKGMVIGKQGKKIKEIGQTARLEIEKFLGFQIFLGLKVQVSEKWTEDAATLKKLGYTKGKGR